MEVVHRGSFADDELGLLSEKGKVRDRVYFAAGVDVVVHVHFGKNVMNWQGGKLSKKGLLKFDSGQEVLRS